MSAAKRKWGQHWLASDSIASELVAHTGVGEGDHVLEIGPGTGRMTRALLAAGVELVAVEVDPDCCARLATEFAGSALTLVEGDLLESDEEVPWERGPFRVVGNLPYNVSSPILRWSVRHLSDLLDAHYMLQLEVAARVAAEPGSRTYGLLSVIVQAAFTAEIVRQLPPSAFRPPPKVDSAFLRLRPRAVGFAADLEDWLPVAEVAFRHRRKQLQKALRLAGYERERVARALSELELDPRARAEDLSVDSFAAMGRRLGTS